MSGRERHYREDELRGLLEELDRQMRESEAVRGFAESQLRNKKTVFPERCPKHWHRMPDADPDNSTGP